MVEEAEAACPSQRIRHCEKMLLYPAHYHGQGSQGMVEAASWVVIYATLRAKCYCVVLSDSLVDLVVWRTDYPRLVVQANPLSVAQAEFPPASVCTDPM